MRKKEKVIRSESTHAEEVSLTRLSLSADVIKGIEKNLEKIKHLATGKRAQRSL